MSVKILIADDQALVRAGFKMILDAEDDLDVIGEARPGGHGLVGMRERAALFGGTLTAGPRDGHGYEVKAVLPYEARP